MLSSFTSAETLPPHALLAGRYRIVRKIGEGGFGVVYQAQDTRQRKKMVAVKQINLGALSTRQIIEATDSYNREITLLPRLRHKNLPRVSNNFTDPTHWYLVMEYIEGETLEDYLQKQQGPLPMREVLHIGSQLSNVLAYLHRQRPAIIFRDVKPANIMRTRKGHLYLIDFGIARLFSPEKSRDTGPLGSPGYAAPEQYGKAQSTAKTDLFGLGVTLQTLLTGKDPLDSQTREADASPLILPKKAQPLQQLLEQMQEPLPTNRPRNMDDVRKKLVDIEARTSGIFPVFKYWRSFVAGLLIGSLPYTFLPLYALAVALPFLTNIAGIPLFLLSFFLLGIWPLVLIGQLLSVLFLFFQPGKRFLAYGILIMLAMIYLAVLLRWLVPASELVGRLWAWGSH